METWFLAWSCTERNSWVSDFSCVQKSPNSDALQSRYDVGVIRFIISVNIKVILMLNGNFHRLNNHSLNNVLNCVKWITETTDIYGRMNMRRIMLNLRSIAYRPCKYELVVLKPDYDSQRLKRYNIQFVLQNSWLIARNRFIIKPQHHFYSVDMRIQLSCFPI